MTRALIALMACMATGLAVSAPAQADPDTDFSKELQGHGIYGQKDFNAWIGKLMCKRLDRGVDLTARDSAEFVGDQLIRGTSTEQVYQFVGGAMNYYCPDKRVLLTATP
jgi:hypothetical protein